MEQPIIAQVLDKYGAYSASLERAFIQSQQRPAERTPDTKFTRATVAMQRQEVARFLKQFPQAWTVSEMARLLQIDEYKVYHALMHWYVEGKIARARRERGHRGKPQRYRWIGRDER